MWKLKRKLTSMMKSGKTVAMKVLFTKLSLQWGGLQRQERQRAKADSLLPRDQGARATLAGNFYSINFPPSFQTFSPFKGPAAQAQDSPQRQPACGEPRRLDHG